ncbi:MAG: class I SAM-dependent methyltransferase [Acidimicrobiia bacterium]|nr:class I SAM-dependent methyltransferase [Acidimicrobiia bacterium]
MIERALWNERYRERGALWGAAPNQFVVDRLRGLEPCRVLDLGAGQGRNAIWLAEQGHRVTAVDLSDVAIEQARELAAGAGVEVDLVAADLSAWEPEAASFDLVLLVYVQVPEDLRKELHAKAIGALAPGGQVVVIAHHRDNLDHGVGGPPMPEILFDEELLAADFAELDVIENGRVLRHVDRDGVKGDAIDIVFMARRVGQRGSVGAD